MITAEVAGSVLRAGALSSKIQPEPLEMNRLRFCHLLILSLLLATLDLAAEPGKRVALIIGCDRYDHLPQSAQLQVAVKDARLLADTLSDLTVPFEVTLLTDGNLDAVSVAFDQFVDAAKGAECALFYFAGHGIEFHGDNFLLVRDTRVQANGSEGVVRMKDRLSRESWDLKKALSYLDETGALLKLVILDACRNNPLEIDQPGGVRAFMGERKGLGRVTAPGGMLISYSADAGEQANDGLFTEILANNMQLPGESIMKVFAHTRREVHEKSKAMSQMRRGVVQQPAEYNKLNIEALDFAFTPGEGKPPGIVAAPGMGGGAQGGNGMALVKVLNDLKEVEKQLTAEELELKKVQETIRIETIRYQNADALIKSLTANRQRAVVQGSREYHMCLKAQGEMQAVDKQVPILKQRRDTVEGEVNRLKAEKERLEGLVDRLSEGQTAPVSSVD